MKFEKIILPKKAKYIYIFFVVITALTLVLGFGLVNFQTDNDVTGMLPDNKETRFERDQITRLGKEFPSEQLLFVMVTDDPFSLKNISKLSEFCSEIDKLDTVKSTLHPFNATYFEKIAETFSIGNSRSLSIPATDEELKDFMQKITSNRFLVGSVVSYDHKNAGILIRMNPDAMMGKELTDADVFPKLLGKIFHRPFGKTKIDRSYFCKSVEDVIKKYNSNFKIHIAGVPVYEAKVKEYMMRDIFVLLIPALLFMTIIIFLNFRTKRGTILPMMTICLGLIWTMGIIGWMGYKISVIGVILPPIIITLGSSYSLYYLQSYYLLAHKHTEARSLVVDSTKHIWVFVLLAAITTMLGFVSFLFGQITPIAYFGFFVIMSTVFIMFFTFFLLPNALLMMEVPKTAKINNIKNDIFSKLLNTFNRAVLPFRYLWLGIFVLAIVLFIIFIPNLKVVTDVLTFFRGQDQVKQSMIFIQKEIHGTSFHNVTIRHINNEKNYFRTKAGIESAKKIQDYFNKNVTIDGKDMIGSTVSPVTLVEDLNYALTGKIGIPDDEDTIKRFFSFLKASGDDSIKSLINRDFSAINFQVRLYTTDKKTDYSLTEQESKKLIVKMTKELQEIAKKDGTFTVEVWGEVKILSNISSYLLNDQVRDLTVSVVLVFLLMLIVFRSFYYAFIGLSPMVFAIIMNFTIMSIFGIPLNIATVLISSIAIGVGIHNSIYYMLIYKRLMEEGKTPNEAVMETLASASRPIFFTSTALIIGFLIFTLSAFSPIFHFGLLIALAMLTCTFATLFIMPALFIVTDKFRVMLTLKKK
jgi:uncharacterized protein